MRWSTLSLSLALPCWNPLVKYRCIVFFVAAGTTWFGRKDWICEHRFVWRENLQLFRRKNTSFVQSDWWPKGREMCYLSGKTNLLLNIYMLTSARIRVYTQRAWYTWHVHVRVRLLAGKLTLSVNIDIPERIILNVTCRDTQTTQTNILHVNEFSNITMYLFHQEEYKDQDELGKLGCRHDFHFGCIKSWLLIKNTCPICKAAAFSESPKEKQTLTAWLDGWKLSHLFGSLCK